MLTEIKDQTKKDFEAAAGKLGISPELPNLSILRPDLALYMTAMYMLVVIIEAGKDGKLHDITDHSVAKYEPWHYAEEGYIPGSSGGGFSFHAYAYGRDYSFVGARLSFNNSKEGRQTAEKYPDLYEIIMLNVK